MKPQCQSLRCKEFYVVGHMDEEVCDDSTVYWCSQTQRFVGPDERLALPERCDASRPCYAAAERNEDGVV